MSNKFNASAVLKSDKMEPRAKAKQNKNNIGRTRFQFFLSMRTYAGRRAFNRTRSSLAGVFSAVSRCWEASACSCSDDVPLLSVSFRSNTGDGALSGPGGDRMMIGSAEFVLRRVM